MIRACVIGLGSRGYSMLRNILLQIEGLQVISVCDVYEDRIRRALDIVEKAGGEAKGFSDYRDALNEKGLNAVFIFSDWNSHTPIALYAMEKGIAVACEVGSVTSLEQCFQLVRVQEKTGTPYMLMENCCWGKLELLATSMARKNLFGTVVHCAGAYTHDLRSEIAYGHVNRHYRFDQYANRCLDNYPTHDLGPIAKLLDINRGNRILRVSSFASKAVGLEEYIRERPDATEEMKSTRFVQGDIVTTVLTCANGETIHLQLDTTLPSFYTRNFTVRGTKGMYLQAANCVLLDDGKERSSSVNFLKSSLNNGEDYYEEYLPRIWKDISAEQIKIGHGGMDWMTYNAFTDALREKREMPIDVYDSATWQAVSALSEISIQMGGAPQAMPDFTNGKWIHRPRKDVCEL